MIPDIERNLPWVEKYRPAILEDLVAHKDIVATSKSFECVTFCPISVIFYSTPVSKFINEDRLPHLLFYGPPGTGKTTTILACARQLYKGQNFNSMVLELNASDDRGIGVVREQILSFASTRTIMASKKFKLIILDEADAMTKDAQNALRRIIEKFTDNVRFCLICNYLSKIIPAIQSRCTRFRFAPLSKELMIPRLQYIIREENLNVTEDGLKALVTLAQGDMRRSINILQCSSMAFEDINEENVYTSVGHPLKKEINAIVNWLLNKDIRESYKAIQELKTAKGLALQDILTEVHVYVHRLELPAYVKIYIFEKMSDIEHRLSTGSSEKIQLSALISTFYTARNSISTKDV